MEGRRVESCGHEWERLGMDESETKVTAAASRHPIRCRRADRDEAGRMRARVRHGRARPVPRRGAVWRADRTSHVRWRSAPAPTALPPALVVPPGPRPRLTE